MCGIAGVLGGRNESAARSMAAAMLHRGPDDDGFFFSPDVSLAFRRLAIVDVAAGHQPLTNENQTIHLIFNGEIYNHLELRRMLEARGHLFRTGSDGEVILHLYEDAGDRAVESLQGMFAFALWDSNQNTLLLARDHIGMKPLYYASVGSRFLFASEIKAMLASGLIDPEIDPTAVNLLLTYQAIPAPYSPIKQIRQLRAGHMVRIRPGEQPRERKYWELHYDPDYSRSEADYVEQLRHELSTVVGSHLMSEVPLGAFLSGGLDSSTTVALMQPRLNQPMHTYSVGFGNRNEVAYSELPYAKKVSDQFGTIHHEVIATADDLLADFAGVIEAMDQPTADGVNSYFVSKAASEKLTVSVSGTGSDEIFFGYGRDLSMYRLLSDDGGVSRLSSRHLERTSKLLARIPDQYLAPNLRERKRIIAGLGTPERLFASTAGIGIFDEDERRRLLLPNEQGSVNWDASCEVLRNHLPDSSEPLLAKISRMELRGYAGFVLLRDIDAMSMHHSLEVRVPFLDRKFLEFSFSIPLEYRVREHESKYLLKRAMEGVLPNDIIYRQKMGFGIPLVLWMQHEFRPLIEETLSSEKVKRRGLLDPAEVHRIKHAFFSGQIAYERRLWTMFILERWLQRFVDGRNSERLFEEKGEKVCAATMS